MRMPRDIGRSLVVAACLALATPVLASSAHTARVEAAFTPGDDIAALIAGRIAKARHSVQVQAYLFTDRRLARALLAALKRGVAVEVVGDAAACRGSARSSAPAPAFS